MQDKKIYQEKFFNNFQLSTHAPKTNFYRRLKSVVDLNFLYKETKANKVMQLSAVAYNLKKYLKFTQKTVKSEAERVVFSFWIKNIISHLLKSDFSHSNFSSYQQTKKNSVLLRTLLSLFILEISGLCNGYRC